MSSLISNVKFLITKQGIAYICVSILLFALSMGAFYIKKTHVNPVEKAKIVEQIENIQGESISIERANIFKTVPISHARYSHVYKFVYNKNGEQIVGWASFGLFDYWIMNEKEN